MRVFLAYSVISPAYGRWFDLTEFSSGEELQAAFIAEFGDPDDGPIIADREDVPRTDRLDELVEFAGIDDDDRRELVLALYGDHADDVRGCLRYIDDHYAGEARSLEDWAEEFMEDTGQLDQIPESLRAYFDFEKFARDLEYGGDVFTVDLASGNVGVFWSC